VDMLREIDGTVLEEEDDNIVERVVRRGVKIATVIAAMPMTMARVLKFEVDWLGCVVEDSDDWEDMQGYERVEETLIFVSAGR
jgi:antirestriction protein